MSAHVGSNLADFILGHMPEQERHDIETHLKECESCAAEVRWANQLREDALRQGVRHIAPDRIVQLAGDSSVTDPAEQEHLASCAACRKEIGWSAGLEEHQKEKLHWLHEPWLRLMAAVLVIAVIPVGLIWMQGGADSDLSGLVELRPLPVRTQRDVPPPGSFEESRALALEAYSGATYDTAAEHFRQALSLSPDNTEILLYFGSAELLGGNAEAATPFLHRCESLATDSTIKDEVIWLAANADLLLGLNDDARQRLQSLASRPGRRSEAAKALLERMQSQ